MTVPDLDNLTSDQAPVDQEPDLMENDVFLERVNTVFEQIKDDEYAFRRCVAEVYVFICTMEQGMRKMITAGGPLALLSKVGGMK